MPKKDLKTRPLLFISQPGFEVNQFKMQNKYSSKVVHHKSTEKPIDDFKEEITLNIMDSEKNPADNSQEAEIPNLQSAKEAEGSGEANTILGLEDKLNQQEEMKALITKLSRYPDVIEKPICEAIIAGKKVRLQVIGMRDDILRAKVGATIKRFAISDIEDLVVVSTWNGR